LPAAALALAVVAGERKEVDAGSWRAGRHGTEHHGFSVLHQAAAGRLLGQKAGFDAKDFLADFRSTLIRFNFFPFLQLEQRCRRD